MKNPLKKIKEDNNLTLEEFSIIADVSQSTIYQNTSGSSKTINNKILKACEELGYNPDEVESRYLDFKKSKKMELLHKKRG